MPTGTTYMHRCLELALKGSGTVAPNPLVGAVLVYEDHIIGEGWHQRFGGPHAEVNCLASVKDEDRPFIPDSTLYVSLEPCAHFGKTPPCTDLIVSQHIPEVVVGCRDPFEQANGKGIEKLLAAGVRVSITDTETEKACRHLNRRFMTYHTRKRPYVILTWAQTADGFISSGSDSRLLISNEITKRLVHRWRNEEASILVGTNTALMDDPQLTNRSWEGSSPVRLVLDMELKLPHGLKLFDQSHATIIFNGLREGEEGKLRYCKITREENVPLQILRGLFGLQIQGVIVEGGAQLLQSFIDARLWDEARIITNTSLHVDGGLAAPVLEDSVLLASQQIGSDIIKTHERSEP